MLAEYMNAWNLAGVVAGIFVGRLVFDAHLKALRVERKRLRARMDGMTGEVAAIRASFEQLKGEQADQVNWALLASRLQAECLDLAMAIEEAIDYIIVEHPERTRNEWRMELARGGIERKPIKEAP